MFSERGGWFGYVIYREVVVWFDGLVILPLPLSFCLLHLFLRTALR